MLESTQDMSLVNRIEERVHHLAHQLQEATATREKIQQALDQNQQALTMTEKSMIALQYAIQELQAFVHPSTEAQQSEHISAFMRPDEPMKEE